MGITRRQFLKLAGGTAAGAVVFQACGVPENELLVQSSIEMPEDLVSGLDNWYATVCRQCPTPEGIVVRVMEGRAKKIEGNIDYPINRGKHSVRCEAGLQALYHPDRISAPLVRVGSRGEDRWEEISWTDAVARLADQLQQAGSSATVLVTEPVGAHLGMVVERFVSRYGARHVPYEPLERTTLREAMKQVFAQDVMPDFDIDRTSYLLSFGADFLNTWVSPVRYARGYGEFRQGNRPRGTMVHVDSRFSMTGANADEWIYVKPGMDGMLALSIAQVIISQGRGDPAAADALTGGGAIDLARYAPEVVAAEVGVDAQRIRRVAEEFASNSPSLAIGGGSAAAHTNGLFNLTAIYSLNYLVGSVGKSGGVVFNPPPPLDDIPVAPDTSSFADWQRLASDMNQGRVRAMLVRDANPVYGLPHGVGLREAISNIPFIASFSGHMDDTTVMADLVLPEHNYLEDWGSDAPDPGPAYQTVAFQQPVVRPFLEPRGPHLGTRSFPDTLMSVAKLLGIDLGLPGESFKDVLREGARQLFELDRGSVKATDFEPFWNGVLQRGGWWDTTARYSGPAPAPPRLPEAVRPVFDTVDGYEFHLIPFASTSLTDGRGAHLPWLQATPDPVTTATWLTWVEINNTRAEEMNIKEGDVLTVVSSAGRSIEALAYLSPAVSPDTVSIPTGQGHSAGGQYSKGRGANVLSILTPLSDQDTGALAWAATRVRLEKTGRWVRLPRFENTAPDLAVDKEQRVIQITPRDS